MYDAPATRRIRVLSFDPSLGTQIETAGINQIILHVPWEATLEKGPVGEYVEVVDWDPGSGTFYEPVDLNDPNLLAQDGLVPSEFNPKFHQQMVYAVAMTTIGHFERALGRVAFWADRHFRVGDEVHEQFVRRLRIYPHALRERNAYYSPTKKALLFGYFPVTARDTHNPPGTVVFTCLSHDIIAHEVTHALLDGVHRRFNEPTNPDVHAFHEAFADIVALFQHFSYPQVLESQIGRTRGKLQAESLLSQLAQQFGWATGRGAALRDALGAVNPKTERWEPTEPDPQALLKTLGAHARGAILVAAVFRAFLLIYRARTADLFRIATGGTGALPDGDIHPDLTRRLAAEAARAADRVLQMCIRGIDYCPPVDITFGDFLRGVVTADLDRDPDDLDGYRTVFIQSFREWGIHPRGVKNIGLDALVWPSGDQLMQDMAVTATLPGQPAPGVSPASAKPAAKGQLKLNLTRFAGKWDLEGDRFEIWRHLRPISKEIWKWLHVDAEYPAFYAEMFGLVIGEMDRGKPIPATVYRSGNTGRPSVEIHSVRPAIRLKANGALRKDLVVEITQRRRGYFNLKEQEEQDRGPLLGDETGDFTYRAGCTLLIDSATQEVRRVIRTSGTITDDQQLERVRRFKCGESGVSGNAFDSGLALSLTRDGEARDEPFALLHQETEDL